MTLSEMRAEVYRRLKENSASPVAWDDDDVDKALNEGLEELSDATEWLERTVSFPVASRRTYYDLRSVVGPQHFLAPRRFWLESLGWLEPTSARTLDDRIDARWENTTGTSTRVLQRGLWWLGLYPKALSDGALARLTCVCVPEDMTEDDEEPDFPEEFHLALVEYAVYDLMCQDGETDKALKRWQAFVSGSDALAAYVNERGAIDHVGVFGGDA